MSVFGPQRMIKGWMHNVENPFSCTAIFLCYKKARTQSYDFFLRPIMSETIKLMGFLEEVR